MSTVSGKEKCSKCGGAFHYSMGNQDPTENYGFCFSCGHGYKAGKTQMSLEEVNIEREEWNLKSLKKLKKQRNG